MTEKLKQSGSLAWLASAAVGPRIVFAPEDEAGSGADAGSGDAANADAGKADEGKTGEAASQAAQGSGDADAGKTQEQDWRAAIEDEKLREFAGKFASAADLTKAAFEFRQKLSKGVQPPGEGSSDEEKAAFRKALGVPDDKTGYQFEMPEGVEATEADKAFQDRMAAIMHETGVPASQAKALNKAWNDIAAEATAEAERVATSAREASQATLRKEWGADYDANFNLAGRVVKSHASPNFINLLETTVVNGQKLGDHPDLVRMFGNLGRRMDESGFIGAASADERSSIQEQINEIMRANPPGTEKYRDPGVQKRIRDLSEKLHGNGAIVGAAGRSV